MHKLSDSGIVTSIDIRTRSCPVTSHELLSNPRKYEPGFRRFDEGYLEDCIEKNFPLKQNPNRREVNLRNVAITEIRALINSLSDFDKQRLSEIVFSIENDKKNLMHFKGITFSGGELRVIPEVAAGMIINVIATLSGLKGKDGAFNSFFGTSAGVLPAASMALNCVNSQMFRISTQTEYEKFQGDRSAYKEWVGKFLKRGYEFNTGKTTDAVRFSNLEEIRENGTGFDVVAARKTNSGSESFFLLSGLENKYGIDPSGFELSEAAAISANLPFLFHSPFDKTYGNCFIQDAEGKLEYLFDGGMVPGGLIPFEHIREDFEKFRTGGKDAPPFYFIVGNRKVENSEIALYKEIGGKYKKIKDHRSLSMKVGCFLGDIVDRFYPPNQKDEINRMGVKRAFIEVSCITINPENGEIVFLKTGELKVAEETKKLVSCSNIPTIDFNGVESKKGSGFPHSSVIDQLHKNLVDKEYINSSGRAGKSAYELYLSDINNSDIKPESTNDIYSAKRLLLNNAAAL